MFTGPGRCAKAIASRGDRGACGKAGRASKTARCASREIASLRAASKSSPKAEEIQALLPDVVIYWNAVHTALADHEFFKPNEIDAAKGLLDEGLARARALQKGEAPWTTQHGLVVRGYVSRLDGSVQPYGLVLPKSYTKEGDRKFRLDFWFHGRGETLSEVNFLRDREGTSELLRRPTRSSCIRTVVIATPTSSPAKLTPSRRSIPSGRDIASTTIALSSAVFRWEVPRPGTWPSTIPIAGRRPIPAPGSRKLPRLLRFSTRSRSLPRGGRSSFITSTTARTGPTTCGTVPPWPTPVKSIHKSRRPTSWPKPSRSKGSIWCISSGRRRSTRTILRPGSKSNGEFPPWPQRGGRRYSGNGPFHDLYAALQQMCLGHRRRSRSPLGGSEDRSASRTRTRATWSAPKTSKPSRSSCRTRTARPLRFLPCCISRRCGCALGQDQGGRTQYGGRRDFGRSELGGSHLHSKSGGAWVAGSLRRDAPQKARSARADRRRFYGQFSVCAADGKSGEFAGRGMGPERNETSHYGMAAAVSRRTARQGRQGRHAQAILPR